jgi:hypothetical protein
LSSESARAYRHKPAPRTLVLEIRQARRVTLYWRLLGVLLIGLTGEFWFSHATADVIHVMQEKMGGVDDGAPPRTAFVDHEVGPLTLSTLHGAIMGSDPKVAIHYAGSPWEPMLLLLLATAAFFAPRFTTESATLILDEREDRLTLFRVRYGISEHVVHPLGELAQAILVHRGSKTLGQLVLVNGERIDIALAAAGEAEPETIVSTVNRFIAPRA